MSDRKRFVELPTTNTTPTSLPGIRRTLRPRRNASIRYRSILDSLRPAIILLWLLAWPAGFPAVSAQESAPLPAADIGVFDILFENKRIGTEKFEIRPNAGGWVVTGKLQLQAPGGGRVSETSSLTLNTAPYPTYYERIQDSPSEGKLVVQFGPAETVLEMTVGEGEPYQQIFYLPRTDLAVLDTNFFHHFALLLQLYDYDRGMAQPLNVFIPQEALPGIVNLQYLSREPVASGQDTVELNHFQAVTDELEIEIWATPEGAIQRISIPQALLEVVRQ